MNLFISTYFNNPHFMEIQKYALKKYITDPFELCIVDDSKEDTKSIISGKNAKEEIIDEAIKYADYIRHVPPYAHTYEKDGGFVPNDCPIDHPTERHRAVLHWILKSLIYNMPDKFENIIIMEADMFPTRMINICQYMENYDLLGTSKNRFLIRKPEDKDQYWPLNAISSMEIDCVWYSMYLLIINKKVKNIESMDIGGFAGTDTGGMTHFFMKDNPQYNYGHLKIGSNYEQQLDFFSKENPNEESEWVHFRAGSNWDYQSIEYYKAKLNKMFQHYLPEFYNNIKLDKDVSSRDGEHTFRKD